MRNRNYLLKTEILGMDVELSNICNLKCPLCLSQMKPEKFPKHVLDFDYLIKRLSEFDNLILISLAGDATEPTLYPRLFDLLKWLKDRDIFVELYSNAMTHDDEYWKTLPEYLGEKSLMYFTICGSTQDLHEKYRVGSDLDTVLRHARIFRDNSKYPNAHLQYIRFEYNKLDAESLATKKLLSSFPSNAIIETDPIYERFHLNESMKSDGVCSEKLFGLIYKTNLKQLLKKKNMNIDCYSILKKYIRMDNYGNLSPCVCYKLFSDIPFENGDKLDYSAILENKCDFCFECDRDFSEFLESKNRDAFYMC